MKHIWLFDLDNTLHDASHAIFPALHAKMNAFIESVLPNHAHQHAANALRIHYWERYGATLLGMIKHHRTSPAHFLHATHQFDNLSDMIRAERGLGYLLRHLPGRKILLTNAPHHYAHQVMEHLNLPKQFSRHITIESMWSHGQLRAKPSPHVFRKILKKERASARQCILVEDTASHLKIAKKLGLRTIWVTQYLSPPKIPKRHTRSPAYMDITIKSVKQLIHQRIPFK